MAVPLLFFTVLYGAITRAAAGGCSGDALGLRGFDPKFYMDMPLAAGADLGAAAAALPAGPAPSRGDLDAFLAKYLSPAGSDLVAADPPDLALPEPRGFLPRVESGDARAWAREVFALWRNLTRRVAPGVAAAGPQRHTLLPLPARAVVPGSGYRELYYWDSYWAISQPWCAVDDAGGLLASKMYKTAKEVVLNLLYLIETYGLVLNGSRSYYTNRSQPPLLSSMIFEIYTVTGDFVLVNKALPSLQLTKKSSTTKLLQQQNQDGMRNPPDMTTLATTFIIPVDLNTFMYKMERDIEFFADLTGEYTTSKEFSEAAKARRIAINSILWNPDMEQWLDYWLPTDVKCQGVYQWNSESQNHNIFASNFIPLWLNRHHSGSVNYVDEAKSVRVMRSLKASGLLHKSGIAASLSNTGQQWNFPNGSAPLQHLIVEGLVKCGSAEARELAEDIATRWIQTNYATYKVSGVTYEKYDVEFCGRSCGSSEYKHQTGFGWSNGVVLSFLEEFGWPRDKEIVCS